MRLIETVMEHARMPVIKHYHGVCITYVDKEADLDMAAQLVVNAKTQRPGVCNALETVLVHRGCRRRLFFEGQRRASRRRRSRFAAMKPFSELLPGYPYLRAVTEADFTTEYLDYIMAAKVVGLRRGSGRAHRALRLAPFRLYRHCERGDRRGIPESRRLRHRLLECLDAFHGWRGVRFRRGDRHLDRQAARPRPHGARGADHVQIPHPRHRAGEGVRT